MKIRKADMAAQSDYRLEEKQQIIADMERMYQEIIADADCLTIKDLAINGKDLINMGIKPGKDMGIILNHLLDIVLEAPENNTPEKLTQLVTEEYLNK
jgi:tRNA nucleotidyltransferase (CCA-adding enzyme)